MTATPSIQEPLTTDSPEVQVARAILKKLVGEGFTDDMLDEVVREINKKRIAA